MDKKSNGFTLVELIVVIAILEIIAAIAVPRLTGFKSMAEERICVANRETVERMYSAFLVENDIDHTDSIFDQYLVSINRTHTIYCIFLSFQHNRVRREYGERIKRLQASDSKGFRAWQNQADIKKWLCGSTFKQMVGLCKI